MKIKSILQLKKKKKLHGSTPNPRSQSNKGKINFQCNIRAKFSHPSSDSIDLLRFKDNREGRSARKRAKLDFKLKLKHE